MGEDNSTKSFVGNYGGLVVLLGNDSLISVDKGLALSEQFFVLGSVNSSMENVSYNVTFEDRHFFEYRVPVEDLQYTREDVSLSFWYRASYTFPRYSEQQRVFFESNQSIASVWDGAYPPKSN